jgi:hypothetical protein
VLIQFRVGGGLLARQKMNAHQVSNQAVNYSKIDEVSEDGIKLFKIMMRLEFALKDQGYLRGDVESAAEVDWDRYVNEKLGGDFFQKLKVSGQASVLIDMPPKKQLVGVNRTLCWQPASPATTIHELIVYLRRVRNNLFHGGKSGDVDGDRNADLFANALYVIDQILKADDVLHTSFSGQF